MKNDLYLLMCQFSEKELRKFKVFLNSKYCSPVKALIYFFESLLKYHPIFKISKEDKIKIYERVYPGTEYNDSNFRSLLHSMQLAVERFLVFEHLVKNKRCYNYILLKEFSAKNANNSIKKYLNKTVLRTKVNDCTEDKDSLLLDYELSYIKYNSIKINEGVIHSSEIYERLSLLKNTINNLQLYTFIESVSIYIILTIHHRKYHLREKDIYDPVSSMAIERLSHSESLALFTIYNSLYLMFKNFGKLHYYVKYKEILNSNLHKLNKDEFAYQLTSMISYLIMYKANDNTDFIKTELWNAYVIILEKELYVNEQQVYMDIYLFRSILFLGLEIQTLDRITKFVDDYSIKVHPNYCYSIQRMGEMLILFEKGEYEKSLYLSNQLLFNDFIFKYDVRNNQIKALFELGYFDNFSSCLHSYREFLRKDKILNKEIRKSLNNFLHFINILYKCLHDEKYDDVEFQLRCIIEKKNVYAKKWLIKKYSEFLNRKSKAVSI